MSAEEHSPLLPENQAADDHHIVDVNQVLDQNQVVDDCCEDLLTKWWSIFAPINLIRSVDRKLCVWPISIMFALVANSTLYFPIKNVYISFTVCREFMILINLHAFFSQIVPIIVLDLLIWKSVMTVQQFELFPAGFNAIISCVMNPLRSRTKLNTFTFTNFLTVFCKSFYKSFKLFASNFFYSWILVLLLTYYQASGIYSYKCSLRFGSDPAKISIYPRFYPAFVKYLLYLTSSSCFIG